MPDHLNVTFWLAIARCFVGMAFAGFLFWKVEMRGLTGGTSVDAQFFLCLAAVCFTLATLRLVLAIGAFNCWPWTRKLGLGLAVFDCVNLIFFPLSTALGLQAFVAYRHSETIHYFLRPPGLSFGLNRG